MARARAVRGQRRRRRGLPFQLDVAADQVGAGDRSAGAAGVPGHALQSSAPCRFHVAHPRPGRTRSAVRPRRECGLTLCRALGVVNVRLDVQARFRSSAQYRLDH